MTNVLSAGARQPGRNTVRKNKGPEEPPNASPPRRQAIPLATPDHLGIHLLSAAYGESIIVTLPDGKWFIVDAFDGASYGLECANPVYKFIEESDLVSDQCLFILLTHLHQDHYSGIEGMLTAWNDLDFYAPYAYSAVQRANDFLELFDRDEQRRMAGRQGIEVLKRCSKSRLQISGSDLLHHCGDYCHVKVISPGETIVERLLDRVFGRFKKDVPVAAGSAASGKPMTVTHSLLNNMSVVLLLQFRATRVLLSGDLECGGWQLLGRYPQARGAMAELFGDVLKGVSLMKAPHHGSSRSFTSNRRKRLSPRSVLAACQTQSSRRWIMSSYQRHGSTKLPDSRGVAWMLNSGAVLALPDYTEVLEHVPSTYSLVRPEDRSVVRIGTQSDPGARALDLEYENVKGETPSTLPEIDWVSATLSDDGDVLKWRGGSRCGLFQQL